MVFTGDISQPFKKASSFSIPEELLVKTWLGNLEGSLTKGRIKKDTLFGINNDYDAIDELCKMIPFKAFSIANNHLLDAANVQTTIVHAKELGVPVVGAGSNMQEAKRPLLLSDENNSEYCIFSFGWENIQCVPATCQRQGVNPYTKINVFSIVREALRHGKQVICFLHWNYELEKYPQPYDRQVAHELIDLGVEAVIGCHAHRVQPIEFYKGKPIIYGLGNFLFCQGHYFKGKLSFPHFCEEEYAFEISDEGYKLHYFHYDSKDNKLEYLKSAEIGEGKEFEGKAVFSCFSEKEYEQFFKKHRVQRKLLPIFKAHESATSYKFKSEWIKLRGWLLDMAMKLNIKSASRTNR